MTSVLIVEDDSMIAEIYKKKFEGSGFEVAVASSGKDALEKSKKQKFDLVLLDVVLPEMNGIDVLKELKARYAENVKVIIFSNLNEDEDREKAFENGADGYIPKSQFAPSELVKEVERVLAEFNNLKE